jgi:hypothetical protein
MVALISYIGGFRVFGRSITNCRFGKAPELSKAHVLLSLLTRTRVKRRILPANSTAGGCAARVSNPELTFEAVRASDARWAFQVAV